MWRLAAALAVFGGAAQAEIVSATYVEPTGVYGHGAIPGGEYAAMSVALSDGTTRRVAFKKSVFEDTAPRVVDLTGDGAPEIVTVVSGFAVGAWVQVWTLTEAGRLEPLRATAPIGQRHRWLAIAGIADFDGDGVSEIAYVDRPHLVKELVIVSMAEGPGMLTERARMPGLTNHRFGEAEIEGGVRSCTGAAPVIVTANADWSQVMETRWRGDRFETVNAGIYHGPQSLIAALTCP